MGILISSKFYMKFGFIADSTDEKTSIGGLCSTSEMEINMDCIELFEFDVSSISTLLNSRFKPSLVSSSTASF